jgi:hypothetical protein
MADTAKRHEALTELTSALGLPRIPERIECYDMSNIQGTSAVGSMVVFIDGRPEPKEYRRFRIRSGDTPDDFRMMAEVLRVSRVARAFPDSTIWQWLSFNTSHVEWVGCSLHDMIQPSFSFLVGVALPYSIASRLARGQTQLALTAHACWRALLLILLGVFLRSVGSPQTNWTFEDTLTQIGLGYPILFLLGFRSPRVQSSVAARPPRVRASADARDMTSREDLHTRARRTCGSGLPRACAESDRIERSRAPITRATASSP